MQGLKRNMAANPAADIYEERRDLRLLRKVRAIRDEHDAYIAWHHAIPARIGQAVCTIVPAPMALWAGLSVAAKTGPVDNIHLAGALGVIFISAAMFFKCRHDFARAAKIRNCSYTDLLGDLFSLKSRRATVDQAPQKNL